MFLQVCVCVCVLKISHPAVILKVSSAFSRLPGELSPPSCLLSAGTLEWSPCPCVAGPPRLQCLPSTEPDDGGSKPWGGVSEGRGWPGWGCGGESISCPLALATCCQARAVSCFSSSVVHGDPPPPLPLCYTSNQRFHLGRGLHRCCRCQRPRCWLPEQDCSCLPGIFVLD